MKIIAERKYQTWAGWRRAAKEAGATRFEGDRDIAQAYAGGPSYEDSIAIGEWDGAEGSIFVYEGARRNPERRSGPPQGWVDYLPALGTFAQVYVESEKHEIVKRILNVAIALELLNKYDDGTFEGKVSKRDMDNLDPAHIDNFHSYIIGYKVLWYFSERYEREMSVEGIKQAVNEGFREANKMSSSRKNPYPRRRVGGIGDV